MAKIPKEIQSLKMPYKAKVKIEERLRLHLSKVGCVLIQMGQKKILIEMRGEYAVIKVSLTQSEFKVIKVFFDGEAHYCDKLEKRKLLGSAKNIPDIKEDLLTRISE